MDNDYEIAIVGMSCRFPGARNVDEFWHNLSEGIESISQLSDQEILESGVPASYLSNPNYVKAAPVLEEPGHFDAGFFGFSPMEAKTMDPQHRILLELAYEALENAGYDPDRGQQRIGVFTGSAMNTYFMNSGLNGRLTEEYIPTLIGNDKDFLSTRISYKLNLKGPSVTVQTACSTSLVAVHLARQSLLSGETDMVLAGAISVRVPHRAGYFADAGGVTSPDGHVRAFDARANGTVFGSGGGIIVMKRLADAIAAGDTIHAVIKGSAVNNDGAEKAGYTAPSVNSQADAVVEALANAGVDADSISYVEAHGSGTPVGDPIEIMALTKAFRTSTQRSGYCTIGSVKTNIGHLDAAAGIAGVIKTVLALKHRQLPPSLHFHEANPEIDFPATPFYVNTQLRDWTSDGPRRAGVMATGMGGTNAHVVLEEAAQPEGTTNARPPYLLVLSAKTEAALDQATDRLREFLNRNDSVNMSDVAYTLQSGRKAFPHRRCLVCAGREDAIGALGQEGSKRVLSSRTDESRRPVIFLLPGIGDQYVGMAYDLYETWPVFKEEVDRCSQILEPHLGIDIRTVIYPDSQSWKKEGKRKGIDLRKMLGGQTDATQDQDARNLNRTLFAQPALFTIEYAMARLWQSLGTTPDAIVGHSMGEYVAACLAGVLSLEDALRLIATRAKLVNELPQGAMLAVTLPENELLALLPEDLSISLINGPSLCVVAGPVAPVAEFERMLTARSVICRRVQNAHAFHSRMLDPIVRAFEAEVNRVRLNEPRIPYISNVSGTWITGRQATNPAYWAMHANHTARFRDALHELWQLKNPILLDVGPGKTIGVLAMQHPERKNGGNPTVLSSLRHHYDNQNDVEFLLDSIGGLWLSGIDIHWNNIHQRKPRHKIPLPTYPFERQAYWIDSGGSKSTIELPSSSPDPEYPGIDNWFYVPTWERTPFTGDFSHKSPENGTSWLVFTDRWGGGTGFRRKLEELPAVVQVARFGEAFCRRNDGSFEINPASLDDYLKLFREIKEKFGSSLNIIHLGCLTADSGPAGHDTPDHNQNFGFFSLLYIAHAVSELGICIPIRIGIISNRIHEVTGEEALDPEMATVLGPSGVIPREFPNVACFNVDLPGPRVAEDPTDDVIIRILSEFTEQKQSEVIAYRGKHRWKRKYERLSLPIPAVSKRPVGVPVMKRLRDRGVYLITGGTGGLGLAFARHLAKTCQARIVLTKKTAFPEKSKWKELLNSKEAPEAVIKTIKELLEIERLGAEVEVFVAEASDQEKMRGVVNETLKRFQAINGVIHAAGIVRPRLIKTMTKEMADSVLSPKVHGTIVLFDLLRGINLDFMVLFSSMSSVIGPYAHADYSAANCFLDAFANYSNSLAKFHTLAINWPVWKEVGIGAGISYFAELEALLGVEDLQEEMLKRAIVTNDGLEAFTRALDSDLPRVIVSPENLDNLIEQSKQAPDPLKRHLSAWNSERSIPLSSGQNVEVDQPTNEIEAVVARIWKDVFGHGQIGIHQQFSALGGHSLIAMQIVAKVRSAYQVRFTLRDLFEAPTIAQLSAVVQARTLGEIGSLADEEPIRALPRVDRRALSSSERLLWVFDQLEPGNSAYNVAFQLALDGEVHVDALQRGLAAVVARHDALRTRYQAQDGEPYAVIDSPGPCALQLVETGRADPEREAARLVELDAERPFDLAASPLWRALLVRISENRLLLGITLHHIVADGWSVGIFTRELLAAYVALTKGPESGLPRLPFQYADFAAWESGWVRTDAALRQLDYWRERLSGLRAMDLPVDFPRPRVQTFRGGSCSGQLSAELNRRLGEFSRAHGATAFMTLLAAFGLLLHRLSGLDDVPLGVPVAGRGRRGTDQLIGMFVNTIVVRQDHSGDPSFVELLKRTRTQALEGYSNAEAPFDHVVDAVHAPRDAGRTPLFQVLVNTLDFNAGSRFSLPRVEIEVKVTEMAASKFDMTLYLGLEEDTTRLMLTYNADLFTARRMQELLAQFEEVLGQVLRDPERRVSEVSLLTPPSAAVLPDPIRSLGGRASESLPAGLARRMAQAAARVALTGQGESWTHGALEVQANRLAHQLLRNGLQRQDVVAIYAHREPLMACAMLGVLKAGGAFAILDPTYPGARLAACWGAAGPRSVILLDGAGEPPAALQAEIAALAPELRIRLSAATAEFGPSGLPSHDPALPIHSNELAYVAFTSGTTGGVKAILGTHGPVVHFLDWQARTFALGPDDRFGMLSGLSHDPLLRDVLAPLWVGGSLHVPDPASIGEPGWLAEWIAREKLTVLHLTPAMAQLVTAVPDHRMDSLRWIFVGGDVLTAAAVDRLRRAAPNATCVNFYGATETPQAMGYHVVPPSGETRARVPVGRGIDDVQLLVVNVRNALAGVGEPGEIVIRTPYLALGYRGDAQLTRERFTASPFSSDPEDRVYRTGDLGRYLPDGSVEFFGRGDGQAKLRGFRLELGEIEAALREHPSVSDAVAAVRGESDDERRLIGYVVPAAGTVPSWAKLRAFLKERLPEYAVPGAFAVIDSIPLTPNGKVDRRALPAPDQQSSQASEFEPPLTPTEEVVAAIFAEVLGLARVGRHDSFFDLGGHSLLGTRAVSRARAALRIDLSLRALFQAPTPAGLGAYVDAQLRCPEEIVPPLTRVQRDGELPLSFSQQRLWFLHEIEPGSAAYNVAAAVRLSGHLDRTALRGALAAIIARHESLRTVFRNDAGSPAQVVSDGAAEVLDLREVSAEALTEEELGAATHAEINRLFDLERGPLLRAFLYRRADAEHVLLLSAHHIVLDAWSMGIFVRELGEFYEQLGSGNEAALPPLQLQYVDFACWQREWLQGPELERLLDYWRADLSGAPAVLALPTDRPRPPVETHRGARHHFLLPNELQQQLLDLSRREGATLFMTLLASFTLLLSRYSGQEDIVVGSPVANRSRPELEGLIGFFVNTLLMRTQLPGDRTFREILSNVRERCLGAYAHQDLPFEKLVEELRPERDTSRNPLFQVMLVLQNVPLPALALRNLEVTPWPLERRASQVDLTLYVQETEHGLRGAFEYATDLFEAATIERMAGHLQRLLEGIVESPDARVSELPLLPDSERDQLLVGWSDTAAEYPAEALLHGLFEAQVGRTPERTALRVGATALSYAELDARANRLAQALRSRGVGRGQRVGLCVERGADMLAAVLGILKAGAAYVPLDPSFPAERLRFMAEDAQLALLVSTSALAEPFGLARERQLLLDAAAASIAAAPATRLPVDANTAQPHDPAYVIYTSGSTGKPKGVVVPHRAVVNFLTSMAREPGLNADDVLVAVTTLSFDIAVLELQLPLTLGATVVIATHDEAIHGQALSSLLEQHRATVMQATPVTWRLLLEAGWTGRTPFKALVGGEALPKDLAEQLIACGVELWNLYGPTETTVWSTCARISDTSNGISIGKPIANTTVYILDAHGNLCPIGIPGEIYIGGAGVTLGYWNRPELTAERFIPDPFSATPGATLYRTGDRARWRNDGTLEHFGRLDDQAKVRGFRIELGEIEAVLAEHPEVRQAAVHLWRVKANDVRIVACCVPAKAGVLAPISLRKHMRARLPEYMVPQYFVPVEEIPLTPNGKIDRRKLPTPAVTESHFQQHEAPSDPVEATIAEIWTNLIGPSRPIGRADKFFEMGGHSLLALRALRQMEHQLGVKLDFRVLFQESLADIATRCRSQRIAQGGGEGGAARPVALQADTELKDRVI